MDIAELGYRVDSSDAARATGDLRGMEQQADRTERSAERLGREAAQTGRQLRSMGSAVAFLDGPLGGVASRFRAIGTLVGQVGVAVAGAMVLIGGASLLASNLGQGSRDAMTFSQSIAEVSTLLPVVEGQIDDITGASQRLGVEYGTGGIQQARAFYQAISAGAGDAAAATELLDVANRAAIGGVSDAFTAVDILTTATNAYAASNLSAADAADILFVGVRAGKTNFDSLASTLGRVIPQATAIGIGFDEVVASVAALTTQGQSTEMAVTGISGALTQLLRPSQQAIELAQQLGIDFSATAVEARGLAGFMDYLVEATGGSNEVMAELFGSTEALRAVFSLAGQGGVRFNEIMDQMAERAGAADEAYERMSGNLQLRWNRIMAQSGEWARQGGEALLNVLVPALETTIATLNGTEGASEAVELMLRALAVTAGVLVVRQLISMTISLGAATVAAITGSAAFRAYVVSLSLVGPMTATATLATSAFGAAVRFALGPVGLLIAAVGLLTLAWHNHRSAVEQAREENQRLYDLQQQMVTLGDRITDTTLDQAEARLAEARATREQVLEQYRLAQMGAVTARQALEDHINSPGRTGPSIAGYRRNLEVAEIAAADARELVLQNTGTIVALERQIGRLRDMAGDAGEVSSTVTLSAASDEYRDTVESLVQAIALLRVARGEERAVAEQFLAAGLPVDATGAMADRIRDLVGTYRQLQMDERIADLREEAVAIGMTSREVELYRMALEGATPQQLLMADAILRTTEEWEKQQDIMAAAAETVSRLTDQNMTALQRYQVEIRTLNDALNSGLDHETYARGVERAQDAFVKADERLSTLRSTASGFFRDIRNGTSLLDAFGNALNSMLDRAVENSLDVLFRQFAPDLTGEAADMGVEAAKGQAHGAASGLAIGTAMVGAAQASALQIAGAMTTAGGLVAAQISSAMALSSLGGAGGLTTLGKGVLSFIGFGGFFADGGDLAAGQWGIVGERGPERIDARPGGGARITPLSQGRDSSGGLTVNIGSINAGGLSKEEAKEMVREGSRQAVKKATKNAAGMVGGLAASTQRPKMNG
ncbi:MAG: phage tail tape measure protein [Alphaproteobacteria bacterium]|nr:phage tail tape measure protein [Alphaproteobacteria bacterium]